MLVTGPTGTARPLRCTIALEARGAKTLNIIREDPIEYDLDGNGQTQANPRIEQLLRARCAPSCDRSGRHHDGEIRDLETAQIAVQAALPAGKVLRRAHQRSAIR